MAGLRSIATASTAPSRRVTRFRRPPRPWPCARVQTNLRPPLRHSGLVVAGLNPVPFGSRAPKSERGRPGTDTRS